ncbi:hypothetical protein BGP_6284 [Beggiatoa sp. PS]|nr:hypothetical protein BGP_6284 [Beggiatoa sp. PS]
MLFPEDNSIIAIASDVPLTESKNLPWFDMNQPEQIVAFIETQFLSI